MSHLLLTLYSLSIIGIIGVIFVLWVKICHMKYDLWYCIARALFYRDFEAWYWLKENSRYIAYHTFVPLLVLMALIQTGQLIDQEIFVRPLAMNFVAPMFYVNLLVILSADLLVKKRA